MEVPPPGVLVLPIDVSRFKLIDCQIKELQGAVLKTPGLSPGRIGLMPLKIEKRENRLFLQNHFAFALSKLVKYVTVL